MKATVGSVSPLGCGVHDANELVSKSINNETDVYRIIHLPSGTLRRDLGMNLSFIELIVAPTEWLVELGSQAQA
jgi:hypothetical protein